MLASVDVDYRPDATVAACAVFRDWGDEAEAAHFVDRALPPSPMSPASSTAGSCPGCCACWPWCPTR